MRILFITPFATNAATLEAKQRLQNFCTLIKSVFRDNCKKGDENCLNFFHQNTEASELERKLKEKRFDAVVFTKDCNLDRVILAVKKIEVFKRPGRDPLFINLNPNLKIESRVRILQASDIEEAQMKIEENCAVVV